MSVFDIIDYFHVLPALKIEINRYFACTKAGLLSQDKIICLHDYT